MFKDPILSKEHNAVSRIRIGQKLEEAAAVVGTPEQSDSDFMAAILDVATLNLMADSHDGKSNERGQR